ncbi:type II secretion system protein E [Alicyclobacillus cellulosilyticus]|uniref:Type II secretion system protein E n=1 Tax=Alicyclobacillus cellulosilyticus TaxID=1003997 RepID=A0A917KCZ8_9BACL|nr:ATPase, T2SS/T4P/T4SS family [Alicyclobacillus cellulosilyticus]GGJ09509.1 type II secretion system protein E [Alicyclobacillus cellulosilyticus]
MARKRIGDLLEEAGLVSPEQLQRALDIQKQTRERLGDILVRLGVISESQLMDVLEQQLGIPRVRLAGYKPDPAVTSLVPEPLVRRHQVLPLRREGNRLVLAMADPLDYFAMDDVRLATGLHVQPVMAAKDELRAAIERSYGTRAPMDEAQRAASASAERDEVATELVDESSPVVRLVNRIVTQAVLARASDLHFDPDPRGLQVRIRVDGVMRPDQLIPKQLQPMVVARIKVMAELDVAERRLPQDGRFRIRVENRDVDVRVSTLPTLHGEKVVLRLFDAAQGLFSLDQLQFSQENLRLVREMLARSHGMVLVSGPTGSGKTSTLYAALAACNRSEVNVITIEDPVEYQLPGVNQVAVNPATGLTFSAGLRAILRQDPDIVMVGEIRDAETAEIAIRAALTGHLVLSTLHTSSAVQTVTRLVDMGVEPYLVASAVTGVIAQRLVRKVCPECKAAYEPTGEEAAWLAAYGAWRAENGWQAGFVTGRGCAACAGTGYYGRIAVQEVLRVDEELRRRIARGAPEEDLRAYAVAAGMRPLLQDAIAKAAAGLTSLAEVKRVAWVD